MRPHDDSESIRRQVAELGGNREEQEAEVLAAHGAGAMVPFESADGRGAVTGFVLAASDQAGRAADAILCIFTGLRAWT